MQGLMNIWLVVVRLARGVPRKVLFVAVAAVLVVLGRKFPGVDLPSAEFVTDLVLALLACHTITDVAAIVTAGIAERIAGRHRAGAESRNPG